MARGKEGFVSLPATSAGGTAKEIVPADGGLQVFELILRFFKAPEEFAGADVIISKINPDICKRRNTRPPSKIIITAPSPPSSLSPTSSSISIHHHSSSSTFSAPSALPQISMDDNFEEVWACVVVVRHAL